jgi:hypothetical protein
MPGEKRDGAIHGGIQLVRRDGPHGLGGHAQEFNLWQQFPMFIAERLSD